MGLRQVVALSEKYSNKMARGTIWMLEQAAGSISEISTITSTASYELIDNLRDLTSNTLEIYLSVVNNKMSNVMKTLTIITTLFMPITFLTGFFGMNFFQPVMGATIWTGFTVFYVILSIMILLPVGMLIFIFRRGWLNNFHDVFINALPKLAMKIISGALTIPLISIRLSLRFEVRLVG